MLRRLRVARRVQQARFTCLAQPTLLHVERRLTQPECVTHTTLVRGRNA